MDLDKVVSQGTDYLFFMDLISLFSRRLFFGFYFDFSLALITQRNINSVWKKIEQSIVLW